MVPLLTWLLFPPVTAIFDIKALLANLNNNGTSNNKPSNINGGRLQGWKMSRKKKRPQLEICKPQGLSNLLSQLINTHTNLDDRLNNWVLCSSISYLVRNSLD